MAQAIQVVSTEAKRLSDTKVYGEDISALCAVRASSDTEILKAETSTKDNSTVLGVVLEGKLTGSSGSVLLFGKLEDASFTFPVNADLFLGSGGAITSTAPSLPGDVYSTQIGHSLGLGAIFISIDKPVKL